MRNLWEIFETIRNLVDSYWKSMEISGDHGNQRESTGNLEEILSKSSEIYRKSLEIMEILRKLIEIYGIHTEINGNL